MSLRRRLVYLHMAFAAFAVATAFATIYGVQLHVWGAAENFERLVDQSILIEQVRVAAHTQLAQLYEIVGGRRQVSETYLMRRDAFLTRLEEVASFAPEGDRRVDRKGIQDLRHRVNEEMDECLSLTRSGRMEEAQELLKEGIEDNLLVALDDRLSSLREWLEERVSESGNRFLTTHAQLLGLAVLIGASGAGLVAVGAIVVRRWLIGPIRNLHAATREFADGRLGYRVELESHDELGSLGASLNAMASSLQTSQTKYRSLFENLRDAVIICDSAGVVVECHDSDTHLLGTNEEAIVGRRLVDVWPRWRPGFWDWTPLVDRVVTAEQRISAVDAELRCPDGRQAVVDVVAYPVEYADQRYAAIVLRDVTERCRLQRLVRRADAMEATLTFARGIAHDFRNLLTSAVATLSLMKAQGADPTKASVRAETALRACKQAARLSSRLAKFANIDQGDPEVLALSETVDLILCSLDEPFLKPIRIQTSFEADVCVRMDRDYLTQVVLNLIHNAREAMPEGGDLRVSTQVEVASNPLGGAPLPYAVLTVSDTGIGMSDDVKKRLFEPLFTTKSGTTQVGRGMGLAVTYAAVTNACGFIQVDSSVGAGTTIRVYLPAPGKAGGPLVAPPAMPGMQSCTSKANPLRSIDDGSPAG